MANYTHLPINKNLTEAHNFVQIYDSPNMNAYPLSSLSHLIFRQNYYYRNASSTIITIDDFPPCKSIKVAVNFWLAVINDEGGLYEVYNSDLGFYRLTEDLKTSAKKSLELITCAGVNLMMDIDLDNEQFHFYQDSIEAYFFNQAAEFWVNLQNEFKDAPVGSSLFVIFYAMLLFTATYEFISKLLYLRHQSDKDITKLKDKVKNNKKTLRFSPQNILAVIGIVMTFLQYCALLYHRSILPMGENIIGLFSTYVGIVIPARVYNIIILCFVFIWLAGMYHLLVLRPQLVQIGATRTLRRMALWDECLVFFLPNFGAYGKS